MDEKVLEYLNEMRDQLTGLTSAVEDLKREVSNIYLNMDDDAEVVEVLSAILNELQEINKSN